MGSINNGPKLAAFQSDVFATGLDLRRSEINRDLGVYKAADAATFEQGQMVSLNATGEIVLADAGDVLGVAKHNKVNLQKLAIVDEAVVVSVSNLSTLKRPNVSNLVFRTATDQGGTVLVAGATDYTETSLTNGTITWAANPSNTSDGDTVFASYTSDMTEADYRFQGRNFFNFVNDVDVAEGRITIILAPAILYTTHFDTSRTYTLTGSGSNLYVGTAAKAGLFTNDSGAGAYVGRATSLPSSDDPFIGVHFTNLPEEA